MYLAHREVLQRVNEDARSYNMTSKILKQVNKILEYWSTIEKPLRSSKSATEKLTFFSLSR